MMKYALQIALSILAAASLGCKGLSSSEPEKDYQTIATDPYQNPELAAHFNSEAVAAIDRGNLAQAEEALKAALAADLTYGLAHNNLGMVYYQQGKYYLAAWEFQYAIKLLPHRPEPKNNLAMVLEKTGKFDQSKELYEQALKIEPDNPEIIGNLARLHIRQNDTGDRTQTLLQDIAAKDSRSLWVDWASDLLARLKQQPSVD